MKSRIPEFFDFMRVERQIEWNNKLFCFQSWGSGKDPYSGMYRYICHFYNIPFGTYGSGSLDYHSQKAVEFLSKKELSDKAFDYIFIDESQDFPASFLQLCELVTSKKIFIAGDVFQNIFRTIDNSVSTANMVLKKCYRTDPKNLMFSHALGMGLFENPVLRWLKIDEWNACGYHYNDVGGRAHLTRAPLRRFEDIPNNYPSTSMNLLGDNSNISDEIITKIQDIRDRYPSVEQGDIAVIFIDTSTYIYDEISTLKFKIKQQYDWDSNISFETKNRLTDKLFISNINNAKGLEFPFVICFAKKLQRYPSFRNALYTMMARSFLESHLLLSSDTDSNLFEDVSKGLEQLTLDNELNVRIPTAEEIEKQKDLFILAEGISIEKSVKRYCDSKDATPRLVAKIISTVSSMLEEIDDYSEDYLQSIIEAEYIRNKKL